MKRTGAVLCIAILLSSSAIALAASPVVNQIRRAFSVRELHVRRGETVRFNNIDEFLHQLYVDSTAFRFSSKEQAPGETVDITFTAAGTFEVKCEIHPKMLLSVTVE